MTCLVVRNSETLKKKVRSLHPEIGQGHIGPPEESGTCQLRRTVRMNKMEQFWTGRDILIMSVKLLFLEQNADALLFCVS